MLLYVYIIIPSQVLLYVYIIIPSQVLLYVYIIIPSQVLLYVYMQEPEGAKHPKGGVHICQPEHEEEVLYIWISSSVRF